jgi:DMATS type aromatic prenyltransferase
MFARPLSLLDHGTAAFDRLVHALELGAAPVALFRALVAPLGQRPLRVAPAWPSDISDDQTPYEFSVALGNDGPEVRALFEAAPSGDGYDLASRVGAAQAVNAQLAERFPLDRSRLDAIADLFLPAAPQGSFALWHALSFRARQPVPEVRVYLNPRAQGRWRAPALVEEALGRLGLGRAFHALLTHALRRGPALDDLRYLSLDLTPSADARVKVYVFHEQAHPQLLEEASRPARNYVPDEVADFCRALAGPGPYGGRAVATCWAFTSADPERPVTSTVHVPVRAYAGDDQVAYDRLLAYAERRGLPLTVLRRAVNAVAQRPLAAGSGLLTYASLRSVGGRPRLTVYLATEAYRTEPPRAQAVMVAAPPPVPAPETVVARTEREPLFDHPFFQRMQREPVELAHMWRLFANIRSGLSQHFPRRLAAVVARVTDERIRSILAKQLAEELGNGDYHCAHLVLFDRLLTGLERYRPATVDALDLEPGRVLEQRLEPPYSDPDGYVGIGAAMVIEIFGKQVDGFVAAQFRRQAEVPDQVLTWLHLHENLELEHADESLALAQLVPETADAQAAVARGAQAVAEAGWEFFDGMYRACYR